MIDLWQVLFFASAASVLGYQIFRGWKLGLGRQSFNLLALVGAYIVAVCGGELAVPVFRVLGYPDVLALAISGCVLAVLVFFGINAVGGILIKPSPEGDRRARVSEVGGAAVGVLLAGFTLWLAIVGIRVLGTIAESEMERVEAERSVTLSPDQAPVAEAPAVVRGLASMKQSLESGGTGVVVQYVDPVPGRIYSVLRKVAQLIAQPDRVDLFLAYPGAQAITSHPKIAALCRDEGITNDLMSRNYLSLLRNKAIVSAANDPEIATLVTRFQLEAALDYALKTDPATPAAR